MKPIKNVSVFRVRCVNILGWVGTHLFFSFFFWKRKKYINLCILKGITFQNA